MNTGIALLRDHLSAEGVDLVERARELASGVIQQRRDLLDRANRFPIENFQELHSAGLLALTVPAQYGGSEADGATYIAVLAEIAKGCASTGLTFSMHCSVINYLAQSANTAQKSRYFAEVIDSGAIFANYASEPKGSFRDIFKLTAQIEADGDGYRFTGRKGWCSLSTAASYYFTWGRLNGAKSLADGLLNVLIPADRAGITINKDWDTLGMRATASNSIDFNHVRIEPTDVVGEVGSLLKKDISFFYFGYAGVYLGIAEAAYADCLAHGHNQLARFEPGSAAAVRVQRVIGEMTITIENARRVVESLVLRHNKVDPSTWVYLINHANYAATEAAHEISVKGMRMLGGSGLSRSRSMQQYMRDAMAGLVMPPANDRCIETIGRVALGLEAKTIELN